MQITTANEFDFSDDEEYLTPKDSRPHIHPHLSLGMGAKASMRVDEVYKNARRTSASSRFSIPLVGKKSQSLSHITYDRDYASTTDSEPTTDVDEMEDSFSAATPNAFDFRIGSSHIVTQTEIALRAPPRGSSFSSSNHDSFLDDRFFVQVTDMDEKVTLNCMKALDEDPHEFSVSTTPVESMLQLSHAVDMEDFCMRLDVVQPKAYRRLRSFEEYDLIRSRAKHKNTPPGTPLNIHEPRTFEKLVQKVFKMTPRNTEDVPYCDGVYPGDTPPALSRQHSLSVETVPPIIIEDPFMDGFVELPPETGTRSSEPVSEGKDEDESLFSMEEMIKYKRWFDSNGIDPSMIDGNVDYGPRFMTPSPNSLIPPHLFRNDASGRSVFSAESSAATTDISHLGVTPSPVAPFRQGSCPTKLEEENEKLTLEIRSKTSALDRAVDEMGEMRLEIAKLQQQLKFRTEENMNLKSQVDDLTKAKQRILVSASRQFDICRRKLNPTASFE